MIARITRSLSARLLGIFLLTSLIFAFAGRAAVDFVLDRDYLREIIGAHMALHTNYMLRDLGYPPSIERAEQLVAANPFDIRIEGPGIDWSSDADFPDLDALEFEPSEFVGDMDVSQADGQAWILPGVQLGFARFDRHSYTRIEEGDYRIAFVTPKVSEVVPVNFVRPTIVLISLLGLAGLYFAVRWLVQPITWIKAGADRIGSGDLDHRIPVARNDELGELTTEINQMADDVQEMLEAKRQLLLAISHELRSPLTRTKVALELMEDEQTRENVLEDVEEMERLIHDLLEGEQLNTRHAPLQPETVDVAHMLVDLVGEEFAREKDRLQTDIPPEGVMAAVDAVRIRLLVKNLVTNALCHSPDDAPPVELSVAEAGDQVVIRVVDHGAGMAAADAERATEPFYRADLSRCRDTGGLGLGLYLCRRIAEAHGGRLQIESEEGRGTEVTVTLPRTRSAADDRHSGPAVASPGGSLQGA
jgi:signal transduction histidine kinase